ncbi:hypothetical protein ACQEVB_03945 [Pseudonocardia sp. CA-107938]|uniref:hypothetical protein n=1 Tax=Pseudonocardia sp. CA-107938 TaxID=3240021 RepID=UPI003D8B3FFE
MRSPLLAIIGVVAGLLLAGCSGTVAGSPTAAPGPPPTTAAPPPSPAPGILGTPYTDTGGRFRITPPADWRVGTSSNSGIAVLFSPTARTGPFTPGISVFVVDSGLPLAETVAGARSELTGLTAYTSTTDQPITLTDGTPAHLLGGTYRDAARGLDLRNLQLFTVHGGKAFAVTATTAAGDWAEYEARLSAAVASLTFAS